MKKQFVTHDIAILLEEIGCNERFGDDFGAYYYKDKDLCYCSKNYHRIWHECKFVKAPLWQQVIDWFREKHKLNIYIIPNHVFDESKNVFRIDSKDKKLILDKLNNVYSFISEWMNTYEEAREAAILEAIKVVKGDKQ